MAKIPFDIKFRPQIESGEYKVETRDGLPVRIICWDRLPKKHYDDDLNLCVLVPDDEGEAVYYYHCSGKRWVPNDGYDLFIVTPEPELTEWQRSISAYLQKHGLLDCGAADRIAKESAAELLDLARNQLQIEGLVTMGHLNKACEAEYQSGLADGKNEALKDLPRWEKTSNKGTYVDASNIFYHDGYYLGIKTLEKLPGFKED